MSACCIFLVYGKIVLLLNQLFSETNVRVLSVFLFAASLPYISCYHSLFFLWISYVRFTIIFMWLQNNLETFLNQKTRKRMLGFVGVIVCEDNWWFTIVNCMCYNCYYLWIEKTTCRCKLCSISHMVNFGRALYMHATLSSRLHYPIFKTSVGDN